MKKDPNYFAYLYYMAAYLDEENIPFELRPLYEGWQLRFPWCKGDVAMHDGTYGHASHMVETYEFPWDEGDVSVLSPEEACKKIIAYYKLIKGE